MNKFSIFALNKITKKWLVPVCLFLFFFWLFFNLFSSRMLLPAQDGWYSGGSTWGDLAFHLSLISSFAFGDNSFFSPENPVYAGQKLSYPFFFDFFSVILVKWGISLRWGLIIPALVFSLVLVGLIYFLALKITRSKLSAFLAPFIFFFNGSIFGIYYFWQDFQASHQSFLNFLGNLSKQYAHLSDFNIHFSNIICDFILPQRTFILGLVFGGLAIYFLWLYFDNGQKKNLLIAGITTSFLPIIHFHSFLAILLISGILALFQIRRNPRKIFGWFYFGLPIIIFALPQIFWILPHGSSSFIKWQFGWMRGQENFWWFWLKNLGIYIPLIILAFLTASHKLRIFYLPFLALFFLANLFIFQPSDFDNMKLMLFWFLLSSVLMADFLGRIWRRFSIRGLPLIMFIFLLLVSAGVISVWRESYTKWLMFSKEDIALAEFVKKNTVADSLFLTSDKHNHFVPCLAGRKIIMGYRGWLWTHGIKYQEREKDVVSMFSGGERAKELLQKYKINFAVIGPSEKTDFGANEDFFNQNFPVLIQTGETKIYKIK